MRPFESLDLGRTSRRVLLHAAAGKAHQRRRGHTFGVGFFAVTAIVLDQARRVVHAELPGVRAAEALAVVVPVFLLLFSTLYLSLSHTSASMFSQKLDHSRALYLRSRCSRRWALATSPQPTMRPASW